MRLVSHTIGSATTYVFTMVTNKIVALNLLSVLREDEETTPLKVFDPIAPLNLPVPEVICPCVLNAYSLAEIIENVPVYIPEILSPLELVSLNFPVARNLVSKLGKKKMSWCELD